MSKENRKIIVLDTSVLLYDKNAIKNLKENDVIIPMIVLQELDRFKQKPGVLGENARHYNRLLDELRKEGSLIEGVDYKNGVKVFVSSQQNHEGMEGYDLKDNDNLILAVANYYYKSNPYRNVKLVTKDINLRIKADAIGIISDDYYSDYIFHLGDEKFIGYKTIPADKKVIDYIYRQNHLDSKLLDEIKGDIELFPNEFVILKDEYQKSSVLTMYKPNGDLERITQDKIKEETGIQPKNKEQHFGLELLLNDDIPLVTFTGLPGSGKTFLSLMFGLHQISMGAYQRIVFTRPIVSVGKEMGFLPGDIDEKFAPWLSPILDNFKNAFGDLTYFEMMKEKGTFEIAPLSYMRGRSFKDSIIIVDEAQNATQHELKTICSRLGENSKVILCGDIGQIDSNYLDKDSNGLTILIEKMKVSDLSGHIHFPTSYRSKLAGEIDKLLD